MSSTQRLRSLNIDNINPHVKEAKYAVRGELATKAEAYRAQLAKSKSGAPPTPPQDHPLSFDAVISANIGNPQQLDQKPITFFRQVLALLEYPALLENKEALKSSFGYKQDAIDRAKWLLGEVHSVGAYSQSQGVPAIRQSVAKFIEQRDGYPADPNQIFLSAGASSGVNTLLHIIAGKPETGVLVPIPQYPLYTASLSVLNARCVPYILDESKAWGTDLDAIKSSLAQARADGTDVRAIVVINPGNPTGASLPPEDVEAVLKFAAEEKLVVIADEVYQTNVFIGKFTSFKKGLRDLQNTHPGKYDYIELASLHSISKGMVGECGHRGGYFELLGFDPEVRAELYKFVSISLCPPVIGQCLVELMTNPPKEGDESYELYKKEYDGIFNGLKQRAMALYEAFKQMEGVECQEPQVTIPKTPIPQTPINHIQGSMYLFPTIHLPEKAIEAAKKEKRQPDEFYCFRLLDATGICVVPGSGFGQKEGTLHFRTTFLAPGTEWVGRIVQFHREFMEEFK
jgi:alanine transaminase